MTQDIPITFPENFSEKINIKARLLDKSGKIKNFNLVDNQITIEDKNEYRDLIRMTNKIAKVDILGDFLRKGEFEKLFNLVGIINQSDPKQIYLKDAEKIYLQRYEDNKKINNLYNILISQFFKEKLVMQKKL